MFVQILKTKSGTLFKFMNFKALVGKQTNEYMEALHLDHGCEYFYMIPKHFVNNMAFNNSFN
jgi:hypothetical protein